MGYGRTYIITTTTSSSNHIPIILLCVLYLFQPTEAQTDPKTDRHQDGKRAQTPSSYLGHCQCYPVVDGCPLVSVSVVVDCFDARQRGGYTGNGKLGWTE